MKWGMHSNSGSYFSRLPRLKKLFWVYFVLLIFEGALRKWVAPQLSGPLLIIRDPLSLLIIWEAYRTNKWPHRWTVPLAAITMLMIGLFIAQIVFADTQILVGLYGLRSYLLPFPVIFIMGENLDAEDLRRMGVCTLWCLLPMTILELAQYLAPSSSLLNVGAYNGAEQIGYTGDHVRSSGTFSFAIGVCHFDTLAGALLFYGMVKERFVKKWLLWAGVFALLLSIPTTGARTLVAQLAGVVVCVAIGATVGVSQFARVLRIIVPVVILSFLASLLPVFSQSMQSFTYRVSGANQAEGGSSQAAVYHRTIGEAVNAVSDAADSNQWLGIGMGRGAVAVQTFLNGGSEAVAGEQEFQRDLVEMGPFAGGVYILFKVFLIAMLLGPALASARDYEPLALLLIPLVFSTLFWGIPEQPTIGGFIVISAAFCIAAARTPAPAAQWISPLALQRQQVLARRRVQRG